MNYKAKSTAARRKVLEMIHKGHTSHIASNFSVIDIATVLYDKLQKGDEVVWSKGWASATIYYFLAQQGKIPVEDIDKFAQEENGEIRYLGLAETTTPGVLCNGGSVGHGLPIAAGIAIAKKRAGEKGTVYCIMSDGEMNEGSVWEAVMFASHHKLNNLVAIIDKNGWQAMGKTDDVMKINLLRAFFGFGWSVANINGHSFEKIEQSLRFFHGNKPLAIIANTVKGKGVSFMENHLLYHYKHVSDEDYQKALEELV